MVPQVEGEWTETPESGIARHRIKREWTETPKSGIARHRSSEAENRALHLKGTGQWNETERKGEEKHGE